MAAVELLKTGKDIFAHQKTILQPAFFSGGVAHALPALASLQQRDSVAVAYSSRFGIHGGNPVAQEGMRRGDIQHLALLARGMIAASREQYQHAGETQSWIAGWNFARRERHKFGILEI